MKFFIAHHQHKGLFIGDALKKEGWVERKRSVDVALFDHHINRSRPEAGRPALHEYHNIGASIITYPHGTTGSWWMDSDIYPPEPMLAANLVIGGGHKYVEQIRQPGVKHYPIGWGYCPINDFIKPDKIKTILFAPIHASIKSGKFREECADVNARVFKALLKLPYKIIVRYLVGLGEIGLWKDSKAIFKLGKPDGSYDDIDNADVVIAEGTYMYLSVARGKPTIGMNQHIPIRPNGYSGDFPLKHWDQYGEYMAYSIDFDDGPLPELLEKAANEEQHIWKKLFIGEAFNPKHFSELLRKLRVEDLKIRNNF